MRYLFAPRRVTILQERPNERFDWAGRKMLRIVDDEWLIDTDGYAVQ